MQHTPKSLRLQIGLFGRTNVGKSSFLNYVAGQDVSLVSDVRGTTTDVVEKAFELPTLGAVTFLDTGGLDDDTVLAEARRARTSKAMKRADVVVLVAEASEWGACEDAIVKEAETEKKPLVVVFNKTDLAPVTITTFSRITNPEVQHFSCSCARPDEREVTLQSFRKALLKVVPESCFNSPTIVGDLLPAGGLVVLVVPIDLQAPKGRLILPQVQTIRDALDNDASVMVVKERELAAALARLTTPPDLVVCDSQVVLKMVADIPADVPCTTFSILFARLKGDLAALACGARAIENLKAGDRILIAEACSHHAQQDDIGRVKIPRWLQRHAGVALEFDVCTGRDYPATLADYALVVHCGSCMLTRRETMLRIEQARAAGVPVTNYGVCISHVHGVLERMLSPFPSALEAFQKPSPPNKENQHV